jgi:hypothetical protein
MPAKGEFIPVTPTLMHLNGYHRATVSHIFEHPVGDDIDWQSVASLLEAIAQVEETHNGNLRVTLGSKTETFEPPKHKDIDAQQVVDLRRMLRSAGYGPDGDDIENRTELSTLR